jgi:predicted RNase H-like HicB family nuclease
MSYMAKKYTVSDGKLVLTLEPMQEGGFLVRSPMDPAVITSAMTVPEAFTMARDAMKELQASRAQHDREAKSSSRRKRSA